MARLPQTRTNDQNEGRADTTKARALRGGFWDLFRARRATSGAGETACAPRPDASATGTCTPPWALPPWQYRPGWDD